MSIRLAVRIPFTILYTYLTPLSGLVIEDAPAGVRSGQAAGCKTMGVITSHTQAQMEAVSPDYLVKNLAR